MQAHVRSASFLTPGHQRIIIFSGPLATDFRRSHRGRLRKSPDVYGFENTMNIDGARRVMETTCQETANQYLRFGWRLINQYVVDATPDTPAMMKYVLASIQRLEDTRSVATLTDPDALNQYLELGWRLIDKYVTASTDPARRDERLHYIVAWQTDDPPMRPGETSGYPCQLDPTPPAEELN
jgi:hypothetical protein